MPYAANLIYILPGIITRESMANSHKTEISDLIVE